MQLGKLDCGFWIAPSYGKSLPENGCFYPSIQPISSPCIWAVGSNLDRSKTSVSLADFKAGSTTWAFKPWKRTCFQLPSHVCCKTCRQEILVMRSFPCHTNLDDPTNFAPIFWPFFWGLVCARNVNIAQSIQYFCLNCLARWTMDLLATCSEWLVSTGAPCMFELWTPHP